MNVTLIAQIKNGAIISVSLIVKIREKIVCTKNIYIWNAAICSYKNGKYVESVIDDSVIICSEIIEETKPIPKKAILTKSTLTKCNSTKGCSKKVLHFTGVFVN